MKKIVLLFGFLLAFASFSDAQVTAPNMGYDATYSVYTGVATDTLGVSDSTWNYDVRKLGAFKLFPSVRLNLDSGGTAGDVVATLQSKIHSTESYADISSVTWSMTSADTAFTITGGTSTTSNYFRIKLVGANDELKTEVESVEWNFSND